MNERATAFGLIRHASTLWNEEKKIQGQLDSPLSVTGRVQAADWGDKLKNFGWQRILCSDLGRAGETARLVNSKLRLPMDTDSNLREQDWGRWSGLTLARVRESEGDFLAGQVGAGWDFRPPGGESRREVLARAQSALRLAGSRHPGERILVVCHEGVIKCLLYHLLGRRFLPGEPGEVRGYSLHLLELRQEKLHPVRINRLILTGS
jgi:probable phosphoglycerate mutase